MTGHTIGTADEHLQARLELLAAEKELTRRGDELAAQRRALPWVRVDKDYVFDTDDGEAILRDLFGDRSQLLVYHFMFGPEWTEGCPVRSFWADNFNGGIVHLDERDVTMVAIPGGLSGSHQCTHIASALVSAWALSSPVHAHAPEPTDV